MRWIVYFVIFICLCRVQAGNKRYYVTTKCGEIIGPDHGAYLQFDSKANIRRGVVQIPEHLKGSIFECLIVVRGIPATGKTKYMAIHWRDFHIRHSELDGFHSSKEQCGKAYVTIYRRLLQSSDTQSAGDLTMCGKSAIRPNMEFEGEYVSLYFYIDYTVPNGTEADSYDYPEVYFKLDVTSFDYDCTRSIAEKTMKCLYSERCIDESLRCDYFTSSNCASGAFPLDKSDRTKEPPGNCGQFAKETTTVVIPPPFIVINWFYFAAGGGGFFLLILFCWCCIRPGYCVWRFSRCRNTVGCVKFRVDHRNSAPKPDKEKAIPRNAILTRQHGSRFLHVDGFSDDGYSGMSSRAESPVSLHGFSSRNTTARGSSPRPIRPKPQTTAKATTSRNEVNTGLINTKQSDNKQTEKRDIPKQSNTDKKRIPFCPCITEPNKTKSTKQAWTSKKIKVIPVENTAVTMSEVD